MQQITERFMSWASILEDSTRAQAQMTSEMPFIFPHLALMPDAHLGKGAAVALGTSDRPRTTHRAVRKREPSDLHARRLGKAPLMSLDNQSLIVREDQVEPETWSDPVRGQVGFRTLIGGESPTPDLTVGVTELPPGGWLGHHRHPQSEVYFVLHGHGSLTLEGDEHPVQPGTAVYIPGDSEHAVRNTGEGPLRFFYTFAVGSVDQVDYHFSSET